MCWIPSFVFLAGAALVDSSFTNFSDMECGLAARTRIVGGVAASRGEFPWLVSLKTGKTHLCGGTILNRQWIMTAAHCLCSGLDVLPARRLRVTAGAVDLRLGQGREGGATAEKLVSRVLLHPGYSCDSYRHDLALLRVSDPLDWALEVRPACLTGAEDVQADAEVEVAGWGWTDEDYSKGFRSDVLQKVRLSVVDNAKCQDWYRSQGKKTKILDSQICAGTEAGGKDACQADSGGPLMDADGTVVGVVSAGIGCARPKLPGLYTRVAHYLDWINKSIQ